MRHVKKKVESLLSHKENEPKQHYKANEKQAKKNKACVKLKNVSKSIVTGSIY